MSSYKVSIVIPVYNVEQFVGRCIQSIIDQTYENLEVIIVDDCGNDGSMQIVSDLIYASERAEIFRIIKHECNRGLSAARNTGINNAKGDYLFFIDSDDFISKDCIEKLVSLAEKYDGVDIIYGSAQRYPDVLESTYISVNLNGIPEYSDNRRWIKNVVLKHNYLSIVVWNKLIKRSLIENKKLRFYESTYLKCGEDILWTFLLSKYIENIAFCKHTTYFYVRNTNSISTSVKPVYFIGNVIILKEIAKNIDFYCLLSQIEFLVRKTHWAYAMRYGTDQQPIVRYFFVFLYLLKVLLTPLKLDS